MINEERTYKDFGYYSYDLSKGSHKKVWRICEICREEKTLSKKDYRKLCQKCSNTDKRAPMYGKHHSEKTKKKISEGNKGKYCGKDSPMWEKNLIPKEELKKMSLNHERTYIEFGYWTKELSKNSHFKVYRICKECGEEKIISLSKYNDLCFSCTMKLTVGEKHYNWNSNLTDEERIDKRKYPEYKKWRIAVYEKDNYTCQICGNNSGSNLNAHHLESYNSNKELRIVVSNGITLCEQCHKDFHKKYRKGNNTEKQFIEFIENYPCILIQSSLS